MNMKQLKYVLTLAEEGSFGRAAETLGISQPSLSQYIKKIETETGAALFDRSGGDVRLTDAGRAYVNIGRQMLALEQRLGAELLDIAENKTGTLTVGTSPFRSAVMMPEAVRRFKKLYPGITVTVEEMTSAELLDKTEHGRFDLCVTMLPVDERKFGIERLAAEELILAVPADRAPLPAETMPGRKYPAVDAAVLDGLPFIMITESQYMQRALDTLCLAQGIRPVRAAVVKSLIAEIAMVNAGIGLALVPAGIERLAGSVTFYSIRQALPRREAAVIWLKERTVGGIARAFIDILHEICN